MKVQKDIEKKYEGINQKKNEISKEHDIEVEDVQKKKAGSLNVRGSSFSGPIPPPNIIKGYEEILPGSADRIIAMAENQSKHRQKMEEIKFRSESRDGLLGIIFAFVLGISCIIVAAIIVILVPKSAGAIFGSLLGITGIGSIIATFITSTHSHSNHDQKR